ncbi:hypothetical protein [Tropicibacter oceani]|uniref:Pilus assembly protein PilP n=1 Tax=Tropicibacter oceani TaxID=3058420 RepID=A0ABY8QEZ1_9RHOB|nr:hypothetical protein [Tropicibacter oceani]WGW03085.1 hypothetical protein QF118_14255 [Tropicibacter oceani]
MLARSLRPRARPNDIDTALVQPATAVTRNATVEVTLDPNAPLLLGTFGPEGAQNALIRLPSGKVQSVTKGDRIQGQVIAAIGPDAVILGNSRRLQMP